MLLEAKKSKINSLWGVIYLHNDSNNIYKEYKIAISF